MSFDKDIRTRLQQLLDDSTHLSIRNRNDQCTDPRQMQKCSAWLTATQNLVHLICIDPNLPYRLKTDRIVSRRHGYMIHSSVGELAEVLTALQRDADLGLLASVADMTRAETFDDFLDHAEAYLKEQRKNATGVIAGVVFEDSLRRVCRKNMIAEKGVQIDDLISSLSSNGVISGTKAKRARSAAHVRTKATHAQWNEFDLDDVRATIEFTRNFIESKLNV